MSAALLWFRTDLRLSDHHSLQAALEDHDDIVPVLFPENPLVD